MKLSPDHFSETTTFVVVVLIALVRSKFDGSYLISRLELELTKSVEKSAIVPINISIVPHIVIVLAWVTVNTRSTLLSLADSAISK